MAQKAQTINFKVPVISVDNGAFRGNRSPASQVEKIFPTITKDGDGSFTNSLIENAYLPLLVDSYGNEFEGCSQLRTINIPLAKGEIKQWFCSNCTRLTSLYAPRKTVIGTKSINYCRALKTRSQQSKIRHFWMTHRLNWRLPSIQVATMSIPPWLISATARRGRPSSSRRRRIRHTTALPMRLVTPS